MSFLRHISHSSMSTWLQCPAKWAKRYIENLPERRSLALAAGSVFHQTLAAASSRRISLEAAMLLVPELVDAELRKEPVDATPEEVTTTALEYLSSYLPTFTALELTPQAVEQEFHLPIPGIPVRFLGYIDLVARDKDGQLIVLDFKTAERRWEEGKVVRDMQHIPYVLAVSHALRVPLERVTFEFHVVTRSDVQRLAPPPLSPERTAWWQGQVKTVVRAIEAGIFPANPDGWWCSPKFCPYYGQCLAVQGGN